MIELLFAAILLTDGRCIENVDGIIEEVPIEVCVPTPPQPEPEPTITPPNVNWSFPAASGGPFFDCDSFDGRGAQLRSPSPTQIAHGMDNRWEPTDGYSLCLSPGWYSSLAGWMGFPTQASQILPRVSGVDKWVKFSENPPGDLAVQGIRIRIDLQPGFGGSILCEPGSSDIAVYTGSSLIAVCN